MATRRPSLPPVASVERDEDVAVVRQWAFEALADGDGLLVREGLRSLQDAAPAAEAWPATCAELQVRVGIATGSPDLIASATGGLLGREWDDAEPQTLLPLAVGAQWLVEDAMKRDGPAVRFRASRPMLGAARWALARALSSGALDPAASAEGAAALDRLYAGAWREREPLDRVALRSLPPTLETLVTGLHLSRRAPVAERDALACDVLWELAQLCEPAWPTTGGPWWTSQAYGLTVDVANPRTASQRHRFALADVYLEIDELESIRADDGFTDEAAEPLAAHLHELACQAVGHAVGAGLVSRRRARRRA